MYNQLYCLIKNSKIEFLERSQFSGARLNNIYRPFFGTYMALEQGGGASEDYALSSQGGGASEDYALSSQGGGASEDYAPSSRLVDKHGVLRTYSNRGSEGIVNNLPEMSTI